MKTGRRGAGLEGGPPIHHAEEQHADATCVLCVPVRCRTWRRGPDSKRQVFNARRAELKHLAAEEDAPEENGARRIVRVP